MSVTDQKSLAVIVGGGAIARALAEELAAEPRLYVYVLSRSELVQSGVETLQTDYSDASFARIATKENSSLGADGANGQRAKG